MRKTLYNGYLLRLYALINLLVSWSLPHASFSASPERANSFPLHPFFQRVADTSLEPTQIVDSNTLQPTIFSTQKVGQLWQGEKSPYNPQKRIPFYSSKIIASDFLFLKISFLNEIFLKTGVIFPRCIFLTFILKEKDI